MLSQAFRRRTPRAAATVAAAACLTAGRSSVATAFHTLTVSQSTPRPPISQQLLKERRSLATVPIKATALSDVTPPAPTTTSTKGPGSELAKSLTLLKQVAELQIAVGEQDAAWVGRVNADVAGPLRIAVVGERSAGTTALVNALLENPLQGSLDGPAGQIRKISYGPVDSKPSQNSAEVKVPAEWLLKNDVEIFELPGFDAVSPTQLEDVVYRSDLIIVVTSVHNRLTSPRESAFLEKFYSRGKTSLIVAVDGLEQNGADTIDVLEGVRERLQYYAPTTTAGKLPHVAVVPVHTQKARAAQKLLREKEPPARFAEEWSTSGMQDLKASIIARVDTPVDRAELKSRAAAFTATQALQRLADGQAAAEAALVQATRDLQSLIDRVVRTEKRLIKDFEQSDLAVVQDNVTSLSAAVREYFGKVKFYKLFWRVDFVADDLKAVMRSHNLLQAEYQMVYAVGKLNEGQHNLYERVQEHVAALATPAPGSPLANGGTPAKLFLEDLIRIQQVLAQKAPHSANVVAPGMQVDPFFLRNQVARFDASPHCDELQKKAEKLVRRHALFQSGLYASSLLAVHLGVPFAVMAPIAVAISAAALGWMRLRWGSLETRFWGNVSHAYKTLKENILGVYEKGFTRGVAEPLVSVIRLLEEAIETRRAEVARNRKAVETVLESANRP